MDTALVVGGTRFVGRHLVERLLESGYRVTLFNRGNHDDPFADREGVDHFEGDRTDEAAVESASETVEYDAVFDVVAYHPPEVRTACEAFADAGAYVYVSSGSAYRDRRIPHREGESPLHDCTPDQETDDSPETYGPRKAEGDRAVFAAADRGVRAMSVRPMLVYGPHDYTRRTGYWIDRARRFDRVLVPGDGGSLLHRSYVADVADALLRVAEDGRPGEVYNVADRRLMALGESVELFADALDADVEVVTAGERELAAADLDPTEFPLYTPYPAVADTEKLAGLGWESTPLAEAIDRTVEAHLAADPEIEPGPGREAAERALDALGE